MPILKLKSKFVIGAAVGSGSTALAAERGGADFLLALNAGRFRSMGAPSIACMLPIKNAETLTDDFAKEELLAQSRIPVFLGTNIWGKEFRPADRAASVREAGFAGIVNFPSCMHYSKPIQQILSRAGRGIEAEVEQLKAAKEVGLSSIFYCASRTQARLAADAKLDFVCLNLGWNVGGAIGHQIRTSLEEVATTAREIGRLIKRISPDTRFFLEGGPIATPDDLGRVLSIAPIDGYVGGSTIERMPLEVSVAEQIDGFRQASHRRAALDKESAQLVAWSHRNGFVGRSQPHLVFLKRLQSLSQGGDPVLVVTEKGIDVAATLNVLSGRRHADQTKAIAHIDCADIDFANRARNILFGHRDTIDRRQPALSDPAVSLLAIHAPARLPVALQTRLARALKDGAFRIPGGGRSAELKPRVVLVFESDGRDKDMLVDSHESGLAPALLEVLDGWTLRVPSLRERIEDIFQIVHTISMQSFGQPIHKSGFSAPAVNMLIAHTWPGNETELRRLLGSLAGRDESHSILPDELINALQKGEPAVSPGRTEKDQIVDALWRNGFNRTRTANALGVTRKTLYNKMVKFGLSG